MNKTNEERLQKALARAGIASRRACEELILAGRVRVNGKIVTELGTRIDPGQDKVSVDDHPVAVKPSLGPQKIYLMLNKPAGYLSTVSDPQGRPTIMDLIEAEGRFFPVGRLDAETTGLLLITNDGAFAQALSHPRYGVDKEYLALLDGRPPLKELDRLRKGVGIPVENPQTGEIEEQKTRPAKVELVGYEGSNSLVRFVIQEGKKRQIRWMARAIGFEVTELKRVRFGPVPLGDLPEGKSRPLSKQEIKILLQAANGERVAIQHKPGTRIRPNPSAPGGGAGFKNRENTGSTKKSYASPGTQKKEISSEMGRPAQKAASSYRSKNSQEPPETSQLAKLARKNESLGSNSSFKRRPARIQSLDQAEQNTSSHFKRQARENTGSSERENVITKPVPLKKAGTNKPGDPARKDLPNQKKTHRHVEKDEKYSPEKRNSNSQTPVHSSGHQQRWQKRIKPKTDGQNAKNSKQNSFKPQK